MSAKRSELATVAWTWSLSETKREWKNQNWEFPGARFHCRVTGSIPGLVTKILRASRCGQKRGKKKNHNYSDCHYRVRLVLLFFIFLRLVLLIRTQFRGIPILKGRKRRYHSGAGLEPKAILPAYAASPSEVGELRFSSWNVSTLMFPSAERWTWGCYKNEPWSKKVFHVKNETSGEFAGGPAVRMPRFHCWNLGSVPGQGTKDPSGCLDWWMSTWESKRSSMLTVEYRWCMRSVCSLYHSFNVSLYLRTFIMLQGVMKQKQAPLMHSNRE